jgi:hypothetical protein
LANLIRISNTGGTQQTAEDVTSEQTYLTHTHDRTDLILETDTEAADYAAFVLYQSKDPELRFASVSMMWSDNEAALMPHMLGRDFGDRISVTRRPPGGGTISREAFIVGVSHDVAGPNQWKTTWALQSATKWAFLTLDSATLGVLDTGVLAY